MLQAREDNRIEESYPQRLLLINHSCGTGSVGRICVSIAEEYEMHGAEVKIAYGREKNVPEEYKKYGVRIGTDIDVKLHALKTRIFDGHGFGSKIATKKFLKWADKYDPDELWLHCIHGYYINIELLFEWIKKRPYMAVKWTQHDCWAFTGHCTHFTAAKCMQWKTQCLYCIEKKRYPASCIFDNCKKNYIRKKFAFTRVNNLKIYTPSEWLANLVRQSCLKEYSIEVKHNPINKDIFKPTNSNFRERYGLQDKIIILGVANVWTDRKGLDDFIELSQMLDSEYAVVLVGVNNRQRKKLPKNICSIGKTETPSELAAIYTAADLYINASVEETYGMTTVEAISCGTKVIVYKNTACEEIANLYGGVVVEQGVKNIYNAIIQNISIGEKFK